VRLAAERDLAALLRLNTLLDARDAFSRKRLRIHLTRGRVWFARVKGVAAGFCVVVPRGSLASVHAIVVAPAFRRAGVGLALLAKALAAGERARCEIRASNLASEGLFNKAGFIARRLRAGVYADGEAAIEFTRHAVQASPPPAH
jgi:ribosomal protein S18 acetylase RimI-like enzyme